MSEPQQHADISVNLNLKAILGGLAALTPLVVGLTMVLQIRQDVRANTTKLLLIEQRVEDHEKRITAGERAMLTHCISREADSLRARSPDAGC